MPVRAGEGIEGVSHRVAAITSPHHAVTVGVPVHLSSRSMRVVLGVVLALVVALVACTAVAATPTFAVVREAYVPSEAWLLDRRGEVIDSVRIDKSVRRLAWTGIADVSPALRDALVRSEDQRFYDHDGVDWQAVFAAIGSNLRGRPRGASTLTMQLAGLLDPELRRGNEGRSMLQKVAQASAALAIERRWTKAQILEAYVNLVTYRSDLQGIAALSWNLFGKRPDGLDAVESAITVALLRGPNAAPKKIAERACLLVDADTCATVRGRMAVALAGADGRRADVRLAPHLAARLLQRPGERLVTTIDARVQSYARKALHTRLTQLAGRNVEDGAVVVLDNATGEVIAWIGSSGDLSRAAQVDHVTAPRQAGSTLKPFLYARAIADRRLTAASILDDAPAQLATAAGLYVPRNYAKSFRGPVSVRQALGGSLNIPAVRALTMVGTDAFVDTLRGFGLTTVREDGDYYGYSLALGSAEVTLLELTNAYRALANGGVLSATRVTAQAPRPPSRRATTSDAAFIVTDMLADNTARALAFGFASPLDTRMWSAVKTGTSKDMRDNWAIGYSRQYTVGVWVGNSGGEPMHDVSGVSGAAPLWNDVMRALHRSGAGRAAIVSMPPAPPASIVARQVRFEPALEPARREYFVRGTERDVVALVEGASTQARIAYPLPGTVVALDPDIPPRHQRLQFTATSAHADMAWEVDGTPRVSAARPLAWMPLPGRHRVRLVDRGGRVLDEVQFEVRGAEMKQGARRAGEGRSVVAVR